MGLEEDRDRLDELLSLDDRRVELQGKLSDPKYCNQWPELRRRLNRLLARIRQLKTEKIDEDNTWKPTA